MPPVSSTFSSSVIRLRRELTLVSTSVGDGDVCVAARGALAKKRGKKTANINLRLCMRSPSMVRILNGNAVIKGQATQGQLFHSTRRRSIGRLHTSGSRSLLGP